MSSVIDETRFEALEADPHFDEGFLLEEFEKYRFDDLEIQTIEFKGHEEPDEFGRLSRYRLVMTDGSLRNVNFYNPTNRVTDVTVVETPALSTGSRGMNEDGQRLLGELGIPSILVGHEGEERDPWINEIAKAVLQPWKVVRELRNISLARQAHVMFEVHKFINDWLVDTPPIDTESMIVLGKSRGAMTNMWMMANSNMRDDVAKVIFAYNIATCFQEGFFDSKDRKGGRQLFMEAFHLGRSVLGKLTSLGTDSANTLNLSPKSIAYEVAHIPTLMRGDAGKAVPFIDKKQRGVMVGYKDDDMGHNHKWPSVLEDWENIIHRIFPGAHGSGITDRRTIAMTLKTLESIAGQLQKGVNPQDIDVEFLRKAAGRHLESVN